MPLDPPSRWFAGFMWIVVLVPAIHETVAVGEVFKQRLSLDRLIVVMVMSDDDDDGDCLTKRGCQKDRSGECVGHDYRFHDSTFIYWLTSICDKPVPVLGTWGSILHQHTWMQPQSRWLWWDCRFVIGCRWGQWACHPSHPASSQPSCMIGWDESGGGGKARSDSKG